MGSAQHMKKMLKLFAAKKAFDWYRGRKNTRTRAH